MSAVIRQSEQRPILPKDKVEVDADKFSRLRKAAGLSQNALLEDPCISRHTMSKIDSSHGAIKIPKETVDAYARIFNCSFEDLVDPNMDPLAIVSASLNKSASPQKKSNRDNNSAQHATPNTEQVKTVHTSMSPTSDENRVKPSARTKLQVEYMILNEIDAILQTTGIPIELWQDLMDGIETSYANFNVR